MPTGRLMKNAQRHVKLSVIQPPSTGPSAGPTMTPIAKMPCALPCSCSVYVSRRIACDVEINPPPPRPCTMRQKTSEPKRRREAAHQRGDREDDDRCEEVLSPPEARGQPRRDRDDDHVGDDVPRDDPRALIDRHAEIALNVRQRDVDDRGVDDLEQRRGDHRDAHDDPAQAVLDDARSCMTTPLEVTRPRIGRGRRDRLTEGESTLVNFHVRFDRHTRAAAACPRSGRRPRCARECAA